MITFQNPGLIDIAGITTMGVSVKEGDGAIGYFGTGLKFAIATILRNGGSMRLWRGHDEYVFDRGPLVVRDQEFEQVLMNGAPLGFTANLGRNWEPWMAFRELASNCRDEAGAYHAKEISPSLGHTTIQVECEALEEVFIDRRSILLESEPIFQNEFFEIHPGGPSPYVYYRGVRVFQPMRASKMRYNIKRKIDLTEDRTAKYSFQIYNAIVEGVSQCEDPGIVREILDCGPSYFEHHLDFNTLGEKSDHFVSIGNSLAMGAANNSQANPSVVNAARARALKAMRPGDGMQMSQVEAAMLEKAKAMLIGAGFDIDEFEIICADTLGPDIHGLARDGKIYLSRMPFRKGTREVAATLFEEFAHLKSGQDDCTRGFQNWLFDQILISVEHRNGMPF